MTIPTPIPNHPKIPTPLLSLFRHFEPPLRTSKFFRTSKPNPCHVHASSQVMGASLHLQSRSSHGSSPSTIMEGSPSPIMEAKASPSSKWSDHPASEPFLGLLAPLFQISGPLRRSSAIEPGVLSQSGHFEPVRSSFRTSNWLRSPVRTSKRLEPFQVASKKLPDFGPSSYGIRRRHSALSEVFKPQRTSSLVLRIPADVSKLLRTSN